jgi:2,3-bisphosphoglycerate-independent phosphoglycerate mutase
MRRRPVVLCVLDGWGHREDARDNAIAIARERGKTPVYDRLVRTCPMGLLATAAAEVGLPAGQMGNSEVGHMNLGAGRVVVQVLPRIDVESERGYPDVPGLNRLMAALQASRGACHVMGLLSPGGVHSHMQHFAPMVKTIAAQGVPVVLHLFLDGRDTPPKSALGYLADFEQQLARVLSDARSPRDGGVRIATVSGRFFTMDRDKRWDRVAQGYAALASGRGVVAADPRKAIENAYARGETDEFVVPSVIAGFSGMRDGDGVLMLNFRADRVREILSALVEPSFTGFERERVPKLAAAAGMTEYSDALSEKLITLFPQQRLTNTMGELVSRAGLRQLRIAETEKYAHVTFFFNGGEETVFAGEDRILVPSAKVPTYDQKPEMSAREVTDRLVAAIQSGTYDFILVNYANADMVGHSGILAAAVRAVETIDVCLGRLEAAVVQAGGVLLITADHGNVEMMRDDATGQPHTAHTTLPVPAILVNAPAGVTGIDNGRLADIAPTLLPFLGLTQPRDMDGRSLLQMAEGARRAAARR